MLDLLFTIVPLAFATLIGVHTYIILISRPHRSATENVDLPDGIAVCDIGVIERDIANLRTVMVVAHKVEAPTSTLAEAVDHNFKRGVKYIFLVSQEHGENEINGYYQVFKAYAQVALSIRGAGAISDLIDIQRLPYNWDDFPYIFYTLQLSTGEEKTLAFRGDQLHEGIAAHYGRVEPALAHTIARAIMSEAPKSLAGMEVERGQFVNTAKVIEFAKAAPAPSIQ